VCGDFTRDSVKYVSKDSTRIDLDGKEVMQLTDSGTVQLSCWESDFEMGYYYKGGTWKIVNDTLVITYTFSTEMYGNKPVISKEPIVVKLTWNYDYNQLILVSNPHKYFWRGEY